MKKFFKFASLSVVAASFAGCVTDMNNMNNRGFVTSPLEPTPAVVTEYSAASTSERNIILAMTAEPRPAGLPSFSSTFVVDDAVFLKNGQVWSFKIIKESRFALPADAVRLRDKSAIAALQSFARYSLIRPDSAATTLFVTAPGTADREWMMAQLKNAGARNVESKQADVISVGWTTPGFAKQRKIN